MWPFKSKPKKHVGVMPTERVLRSFTPLVEFNCKVTDTTYIVNQTYHLREGNEGLAKRCKKWETEGKIEWL